MRLLALLDVKIVIACAFINYIIQKLVHAQTVDTRLSFSPSGKKRLGLRLQMAKFCCSESKVLKRSSEVLTESHLERSRSKYSIMTNAHVLKLIGYWNVTAKTTKLKSLENIYPCANLTTYK